MKSLFYLLLLANLTFFLWEQFVRLEPSGSEPAGKTERQFAPIVLLKELPPPPQIVAKPAEAEMNAAGTPPAQAEPPASGETAAPPETPARHETPPAAPPNPVAVAETSPASAEPPVGSAVEQAEKREFCARLGPFAAEMDAKAAGRGIDGIGEARVESRVRPEESGYWVLRSPAASLEEAKTVKRKLMEQGAKETLVLRDGENANAVSLGFFSSRERAENLLREYRAKGFEGLEIRPRHDGKTEYWLRIRARAEAVAWSVSLERLRKRQPALSVEEKEKCGENGALRD